MATSDENVSQRLEALQDQDGRTSVMLVGAAGAGKSSLINSVLSLIDSRDGSAKPKRSIPTAPPDSMGGHTMLREPVELTDSLTVVDNRGWHDWGKKEALQELVAQINGERAFIDDVDWEEGAKEEESLSGVPLVLADKINCIALVINGKGGIDALQDMDKLVMTCLKQTGRRPLVVVTHKDEVSDEQVENIKSTLETDQGVGRERVFVIRNITSADSCLEEESKLVLLHFLESCIADGEMGTKFHDRKVEGQKKRVEYMRGIEEDKIQKQKKDKEQEIEAAVQDLELSKTLQQQLRFQMETDKEKALAQLEEDMKKDERKHLQKMNKEKEESFARAEQAEQDRKKEQQQIAANREKALSQLAQDTKKAELKHTQEMNKKEEESWLKLKQTEQQNKLEAEKYASEVDAREKAKFMKELYNVP